MTDKEYIYPKDFIDLLLSLSPNLLNDSDDQQGMDMSLRTDGLRVGRHLKAMSNITQDSEIDLLKRIAADPGIGENTRKMTEDCLAADQKAKDLFAEWQRLTKEMFPKSRKHKELLA